MPIRKVISGYNEGRYAVLTLECGHTLRKYCEDGEAAVSCALISPGTRSEECPTCAHNESIVIVYVVYYDKKYDPSAYVLDLSLAKALTTVNPESSYTTQEMTMQQWLMTDRFVADVLLDQIEKLRGALSELVKLEDMALPRDLPSSKDTLDTAKKVLADTATWNRRKGKQ